jgi:hypothetical protein
MKSNPAPAVAKPSPAGKQFPLSGAHQPVQQQSAPKKG